VTRFTQLHLADVPAVGRLSDAVADALSAAGLAAAAPGGLALAPGDPTARLADAADALRARDLIGPPRAEAMPVRATPEGPDLAAVDRSALRALGFWGIKVHVNGLVAGAKGPMIWMSRRSPTALSHPGAWDTLVAGGAPVGASIAQSTAAEAREEAGIGPALIAGLRPVRRWAVHYESDRAVHREWLAPHDLWLPAGFRPECCDGEIVAHALWSPARLAAAVADGALKPNSAAVCADLLARLGAMQAAAATPGR
jgi:8-oxo-dGTP pyrophosphatase MutT (NUDIX family)